MRLFYLFVLICMCSTANATYDYEMENDSNEIQQAQAHFSPEKLFEQGVNYYHGIGVKKNVHKAQQFFEAAAGMGNAKARAALSDMKNTENRNSLLAEQVTKQAADHGDPDAEYQKGMQYLLGEQQADYNAALLWLKRAALKNHAEAQNELGYMYMAGLGVAKDYKQSFEWYQRSAKQGIASAQYNLGLLYKFGLGIPADPAKANSYFKLASSRGFNLGRG